jgi:hypothetical protein
MLYTPKWFIANVILAAALAAAPALAQTNDKNPANAQQPPNPAGARPPLSDRPVPETERLTEIEKSLESLRKEVAELKSAMAPLANLPKSVDTLSTLVTTLAEDKVLRSEALRDQLSQLKSDVQALRDRLRDTTRIAAYPPPDVSTSAAAPAAGRVDLINNYSLPVSIVVNQRRYELLPGERRLTDPIPAGTYTYEVLGITPLQSSVIAANTTRTIEVFPRQ